MSLKNTYGLLFQVAYIANDRLHDVVKSILNLQSLPTHGLRAVVTALAFCENVNLYGFYPFTVDQEGKSIPFHYYDELKKETVSEMHGWNEEFELLQTLHKNRILRLVTGKCT
ncbi:CMP-N-acetylneuraminate-poly-alpha-2,8-sialyltransferase-like [Saccoglossus kowalevskii]